MIGLRTQLGYYKKELRKIGNAEAAKTALYFFSIGTNDYISPFLLNSTLLSSYPRSKYVDMVIGNLSMVVKVSPISIFNNRVGIRILNFISQDCKTRWILWERKMGLINIYDSLIF